MNQRINKKGLDLIKSFEGFSNTVYKCSAGYDTIGYGHKLRSGEIFTDVISKDYAEKLLKLDLIIAETGVEEAVHRDLTSNQFSACVSFAYNLGVGAFAGSTLCKLINNHSPIPECAPQFLRWNKERVNGVLKESAGLTRRRKAEMELFLDEKNS